MGSSKEIIQNSKTHPYSIQLQENDWIYFLHIPKTAGTSLYYTLRELFPSKCVLIIEDTDLRFYFKNTRPDDFSHVKFSRQHSWYDYYANFSGNPYFITMLRDPVNRAFSLYKHVCRVDTHYQHEILKEKNFDPRYFFTKLGTKHIENVQVRMLVGYPGKQNYLSQDDMLQIAKLRLNQFAFFGIQERYEESIHLLESIFNWPSLEIVYQNTADQKSESYDPELVNVIKSVNSLDQKLYDYASNLFSTKFEKVFGK